MINTMRNGSKMKKIAKDDVDNQEHHHHYEGDYVKYVGGHDDKLEMQFFIFWAGGQ